MTRALLLLVLATSLAHAQQPEGKVDAKSLMASGVRLLEAKDYLGALAVFRDAYARFPSAKILLNIGTTLNLLERKAEAGNAYQRYLDSADADPAKRNDVLAVLAEIDKVVGRLEIRVTPDDAEIQINDGEWQPAAQATLVRVTPGAFTVRGRKDAFTPDEKSAQIVRGDRAAVVLALTAIPETPAVVIAPPLAPPQVDAPPVVDTTPRSRLGLVARGHIDATRGGGAGLVGLTVDVVDRLEAHAAAILGPSYGAYAGASLAILTGATRPYLAAGMPVFFSNGARYGVRGAGGVELRMNKRFAFLLEVGAELMLNPEDNILDVAFIPAVGATARL